jgi:aromatic-L-amino-acid decarboxylase
LIIASAGTTNTGSVDPLAGIASTAAEYDLWFHCDGAYGGFFVLTERGRARLRGIERADSVTLDPHKGLFLPYGTGALLVRDGAALKRAHHVVADYMPPMQQEADLVDFSEISPELSSDFRGLRVWLPIKLHGIEVFRQEKLLEGAGGILFS